MPVMWLRLELIVTVVAWIFQDDPTEPASGLRKNMACGAIRRFRSTALAEL